MTTPWEDYQQASPAPASPAPDGPWNDYIAASQAPSPSMAEGTVRAAATGVPIIGGALNKLDAATNATLAPVLNHFFSPDQQLQEPTWGERYQRSLGDQNQADQSFQQQHPVVDTAAKIAGGVAATVPIASTAIGARLLGMTGASLPVRIGTSALSGAAIGGADAATRGEDVGTGAIVSGGLSAAAPLAGRAVGGLIEGLRGSPSAEIPSAEAIGDAAQRGYEALRNSGVEFKPDAIASLAQTTEQSLMRDGLRPTLAPKTFSVLSELQNPAPGSSANFADVHALRRVLGQVAGSPDATERMAASRTMEALDGFMASPPAGAVLSGDATAAAKTLADANANYAAMKTSGALQGKVDAADLQASSANSGANFENALRQRLRAILTSPAQRRGYSPDEIIAMQSIVRGTAPANIVRTIGNLLGGGGGLGSVASGAAGFAAGGPIGAVAAPAAGYALKQLGNTMVANKANALDELIRSRAPAAQPAVAARAAALADRQRRLLQAVNAATVLSRGAAPALSPGLAGQ